MSCTLAGSVPIGTLWECVLLWAYANGHATLISFSTHPFWFVALIVIVLGIHFWTVWRDRQQRREKDDRDTDGSHDATVREDAHACEPAGDATWSEFPGRPGLEPRGAFFVRRARSEHNAAVSSTTGPTRARTT